MANVHLFLLLALVTFHGVYQIVDAVACAKDSDCVSTDNVLAKCTSGLCKCKSDFYPITTGCGTRLPKPTVSFDGTNSGPTEAYDKAKVSLKCLAPDVSDITTLKYVWSKNGNILAKATVQIYEFTADISQNNGKYSCRVTLPDAADSLESNTFQITVLSTNAAPTNKPMITAIDSYQSLPGETVKLACTNLPIGASSSGIVFKDGTTTIPKINVYKVLANSQITCEYKGKVSNQLKFFKNSDKFPKPWIETTTATGGAFSKPPTSLRQVIQKGSTFRASCRFTGQITHVVTLNFYKNGNVIPGAKKEAPYYSGGYLSAHKLDTSTPGEYTFACSGQVIGDNFNLMETKSNPITIVVQGDDLKKPTIELKPAVANFGDHVSLKCRTDVSANKIQWLNNEKIIYGQSDTTIQLHNVQLSTDQYSCIVTNGYQHGTSNSKFAVSTQPILSVSGATDPSDLTRGTTFTLVCQLTAASKDIEYRFYKGPKRISETLHYVTKANNGRYTCAAVFNGVELSRSQELVISVGGPGQWCASDSKCEAKGQTGNCAGHRCVCKADHHLNSNNVCTGTNGGNTQTVAISLVGIILCLAVSTLDKALL